MKLIDLYEDSVQGSLTDEENIGFVTKMVAETGLRKSQYERMVNELEGDRLAAEWRTAQAIANESGKASRQIAEQASKLTRDQAAQAVDIMTTSQTNMTRLATPDSAVVASEVQRVVDSLGGTEAGDYNAAAWRSFLGTGVDAPTGRLFGAHLPAVYDAMAQEFGAFDPSSVGNEGVPASRHAELDRRVQVQRGVLRRVDEELQESQSAAAAFLAAYDTGDLAEVDKLGKRLSYLSDSALTKAHASVRDPVEYARKLQEVRDKDPAYQKLVERSDKAWDALDQAQADSGGNRAAFARLLSNDDFQAWASSNGFTVGTSKVDEKGGVIEFNPGKDLMVAFRVAQKQKRKRPVASDEGAFISRPGERDLVRLVTKDGEIVLGRKLPMQAADAAGSHRMSTAGGERYFDPTQVGRFDVVKTKKRFDLAGEVVKARGDRDAKLAAMALEAAQKRGELLPGGELPEAGEPTKGTEDKGKGKGTEDKGTKGTDTKGTDTKGTKYTGEGWRSATGVRFPDQTVHPAPFGETPDWTESHDLRAGGGVGRLPAEPVRTDESSNAPIAETLPHDPPQSLLDMGPGNWRQLPSGKWVDAITGKPPKTEPRVSQRGPKKDSSSAATSTVPTTADMSEAEKRRVRAASVKSKAQRKAQDVKEASFKNLEVRKGPRAGSAFKPPERHEMTAAQWASLQKTPGGYDFGAFEGGPSSPWVGARLREGPDLVPRAVQDLKKKRRTSLLTPRT